jgi:acyl-CoA synthetase (AMP-forming)/AMP-acid ligase II
MIDALHTYSLADVPREHRRSYPNRIAVVDGEARHTWPVHDERVTRLANALRDAGVGRGDVVLWTGQNSHRILECLAAVARIGAIVCVVNWRQSADELAFVLDDADAKVVIWQEAEVGEAVYAARAAVDGGAAGRPGGRWLRHDVGPDDAGGYEAFLAAGSPDDPGVEVDPADPVLMLYTAAFLGTPNGALLSHQAVLVQSLMMANLQRVNATYTYLNSGPMFHVATLMTTLATYLFAGTNVFVPRPEPHELCRAIEAEHCTGAFLMGPTIDQILEANEGGRYDLSSLRTFRGKPAWNEMITVDESPWALKPAGFGQTEVMGMLTYNAVGGEGAGGAGRPSPVAAVRIVDPDGAEVAAGETGEIVARGPQVMSGYRNRPEDTALRQSGGWHHTGDLGRREADGSLSFVGPKGRLIKSAAENIYPAEVEAALTSHPAVREAAVIGVPDPKWEQSVRAIVVLVEGEAATEEEIIGHVRSKIASYKKPKSVVFRTEPLPRRGWPIDYDTLDADYGGGGYPGMVDAETKDRPRS